MSVLQVTAQCSGNVLAELLTGAFRMPQDPFEFESEWLNGNSVTKQFLNSHSSDLEKLVEQSDKIVAELPLGSLTLSKSDER